MSLSVCEFCSYWDADASKNKVFWANSGPLYPKKSRSRPKFENLDQSGLTEFGFTRKVCLMNVPLEKLKGEIMGPPKGIEKIFFSILGIFCIAFSPLLIFFSLLTIHRFYLSRNLKKIICIFNENTNKSELRVFPNNDDHYFLSIVMLHLNQVKKFTLFEKFW